MAIIHRDQMIGLMWDPSQKWDGVHDRPSTVFSSPNWLQGGNNHLMGLFLPSVPQWVNENTLLASTPYTLQPDKAINFKFRIISSTAHDAAEPVRFWYKKNPMPSLPTLSPSYSQELSLWDSPVLLRPT